MASSSSLLSSLRGTLRSPWTLGPWVVAGILLPYGAAWTNLSILDRHGATGGTPTEFAFLASLVAVMGANTALGRVEWLLARTGRWQRVGHELLALAVPALLAPLGVLLIGASYWGWGGPEALLAGTAGGMKLTLLALLLNRAGLGPGISAALLPLLGWWLPATLGGMPGAGPWLASLLSAGTWPAPNDSAFGFAGAPAAVSLAGWFALLLVCTPGRGRHAIRNSR